MNYLTDRKRAQGLGSAKQGSHHHWVMIVSSIALVLVVPFFVLTLGSAIGGTHEEVLAFFSRPVAAIFTGLALAVIINHVKHEAHEAIEDYMHGVAQKLTLVATSVVANTLIAAGLFALVKLAL
ncbi:MAG: succinate dehydrogenase, hydrophobic membrane anchor protein [Cognatishimia sp.]|uniref:succinate dehydrogenase, hydrophobic membrane anchor protein n=1 Tax=Cognatishimia sp. 1_MG-2023 TaxID=3062642 RepID=UPI0026E3CD3E|nr:succinate dehydrogenase, hydrophobic membrane anchor protein [Cognatishimia sp. 1_MG-2023]MDO6726145.1 succinate dehydrogenase, hydrophobic membrane anchor protein [Cognatishimia sp. 1_MG-2023]